MWRPAAGFPEVVGFPELKILRLYISCGAFDATRRVRLNTIGPSTTFATLTTLHVECLSRSPWWEVHSRHLKFPNLQVLSLRDIDCPPDTAYGFIHRHPTLLQVNVNFVGDVRLAVTGVLKLADGTGTWSTATDGLPVTVADTVIAVNTETTTIVHPAQGVDLSVVIVEQSRRIYMACGGFAWCRTALHPYSTLWPSLQGSSLPRYAITELALSLIKHGMPSWVFHAYDSVTFPDYFLIGSRCPEVRRLRLVAETRRGHKSFANMMVRQLCSLEWSLLMFCAVS